jgi:transcriptional antiterminator RfaH
LLENSALMGSNKVGIEQLPGSWNVAYTKPKRERVAADNLIQQGFEAYLPMYRTFRKSAIESTSSFEPMFPRYIFFKPAASQSLSAARSTRGIAFVISFGSEPALLNDSALEAIRRFEQQRGLADMEQLSPFRVGVKVGLSGENMAGIEGLVTSVSGKRVHVLIELLGGSRRMSVEHHQLKLV